MTADELTTKVQIETAIFDLGEQVNEIAYKKYTEGELSQAELESAYRLLSDWTTNGTKLLEIVG